MRTGTKSLLFGVHNIIWHPITVLMAWCYLYKKWPSPKELFCIIIHDWGYWGYEHMDDEKGQKHPWWAANLVWRMFSDIGLFHLCLFHSRHLARMHHAEPSKLCWADKLSTAYDPCWFYLLRARLTGELKEYRANAETSGFCPASISDREWFYMIREYMRGQAINQKSSTLYMKTEETRKDVSR